ncbi:response regulator [Anatilimnocola floriformis]|uniref:response regulator n=1 Tax=Anatilimnocola floriformis TaxID=2948575 RepID=UPI0020C229E9|nr:response regulator [Anatilimnocola floriformis]
MNRSILIVDDNPDQVDSLARWFILDGWHVVGVIHPRQALEAASFQQFQVALLDLSLPEIDGIQLMRQLKRTQEVLQVILLSGHDVPASEAKAAGAFACLTKPCGLALLKARVNEAFEQAASACELNAV